MKNVFFMRTILIVILLLAVPCTTFAAQWNMTDVDVSKNGNMAVGLEVIRANPDYVNQCKQIDIADAYKRPWNYYGSPISVTGVVGIVEESPPGSEISKFYGGEVSEIVILADGGIPVDMTLLRSSGDLTQGQTVTLYGYVIGKIEVTNALGGKVTNLVLVGNTYSVGGGRSKSDGNDDNNEKATSNAEPTASKMSYDYQGSAEDLMNEFTKNSFAAEEKFIGKRIKITGPVESIERGPDGNPVVSIKIYAPIDLFGGAEQLYNRMDSGNRIICSFGADQKSNVAKLKSGNYITLIGTYKGVEDFITKAIVMTDCVVFVEEAKQNNSDNNASSANNQSGASNKTQQAAAEELLTKTLKQMGQLTNPEEKIAPSLVPQNVINGEQCWMLETSFFDERDGLIITGKYAISKSGKIYKEDENYNPFLDEYPPKYFPFGVGENPNNGGNNIDNSDLLMIVDITGNNVNVRNAPNAKGKVLFQVSKGKDFLAVNKTSVKDNTGQTWYEVIFRYAEGEDEDTFILVGDQAYITGKFVQKHPESEQAIEDFGLGYYYQPNQ
jgi:hypothetical protein